MSVPLLSLQGLITGNGFKSWSHELERAFRWRVSSWRGATDGDTQSSRSGMHHWLFKSELMLGQICPQSSYVYFCLISWDCGMICTDIYKWLSLGHSDNMPSLQALAHSVLVAHQNLCKNMVLQTGIVAQVLYLTKYVHENSVGSSNSCT